MFITGPKVIETVTGEKISSEGLGGANVHNAIVVMLTFARQLRKQLLQIQQIISYLPQNNKEKPP